jgi:cytochrome P450
MPYTEACLRENLRYNTLVPSSVPHRSTVDTKLNGYFIPKNTIVIPSLHALHTSKEVWKDPENFRPERFLNNKGQLSLKFDKSLPFGGGRRLCAGETFARNTMFLCVTALLQNFNIKTVDDGRKIRDNDLCGLAKVPHDFWVKFEVR